MAVGIKIFGDKPLGWRYMSTLFGSLTLVGMYLWALVLFKNRSTALFAALLTLVNQLLYVHARIAILEVFMFAFTVFALVCFCAAWSARIDQHKAHRLCLGAGVLFGLAMACKWAAVVPWLSIIGLIVLVRTMQHWKTVFQGGLRGKRGTRDSKTGMRPIFLPGSATLSSRRRSSWFLSGCTS